MRSMDETAGNDRRDAEEEVSESRAGVCDGGGGGESDSRGARCGVACTGGQEFEIARSEGGARVTSGFRDARRVSSAGKRSGEISRVGGSVVAARDCRERTAADQCGGGCD